MNQTSSLFASSNNNQAKPFGTTTSTFGGTSLFGGTTPQTQNTSLFGSTNANRFGMNSSGIGSAFGGTMGAPVTGTTVKFVAQTATDTMIKNGHTQSTNININLQCITCMREYESKSLEELRMEDYAANRKGPQQAQQQTGLFGSTNNTGSFFSNNTSAFGTTTPATGSNLFGSNTLNNQQNKLTFGTPAASTNTLFGQENKPSFFSGATPQATGFQNQPQPSLFGSTAVSQPASNTGSLFGSGLNTNSNNLFNAPTSQSSSLFNKPLFGNTTTPAFGAQATSNTSLFSNPTNTSSIFGASTSQPSLFNAGSAANNTSLTTNKPMFSFSNQPTQTTAFPSFGTSTSTSNLFGNTGTSFGANTGSNLFSSNQNNPSAFSFGQTPQNTFSNPNTSFSFNQNSLGNATTSLGSTSFNGSQAAFPNASNQVNTDQIMTRLLTLPYGPPQLSGDNLISSNSKTKFTTDPKELNQYKLSVKSETQVCRVPKDGKTVLFDGLDDESTENLLSAHDIFKPRSNFKKLVLSKADSSLNVNSSPRFSTSLKENNGQLRASSELNKENVSFEPVSSPVKPVENTIDLINNLKNDSLNSESCDGSFTLNNSSVEFDAAGPPVSKTFVKPKCGIILTRSGYYTIPSIDECDSLYDADNDSCVVESFTVGRVEYGSIFWKGPIDVKDLNLDEIVHIRRKEVIVYPDDDVKPPVGEGLNRPAQVTLDQVWPVDKSTRAFIKDPERLKILKYAEKIENATNKLDAVFKEYRPDTGSWVFTVKHFSKYGLEDEDDELEPVPQPTAHLKINPESNPDREENFFSHSSHPKGSPVLNSNEGFLSKAVLSEPIFEEQEHSYNDQPDLHFFDFEPKKVEIKPELKFTIFDEDFESVAKKLKNFPLTDSEVSQSVVPEKYCHKPVETVLSQRMLSLETTKTNCLQADINSFCSARSPRVSFINGSNSFCISLKSQVLLFSLNDLVIDQKDGTRLEEQLNKHVSIKQQENLNIPPLIETAKFSLNKLSNAIINSLIESLYGELVEVTTYSRYQERLGRILNWLFTYNKALPVPNESFARITHFLTTNELEFAITECVNAKCARLSYLVASGPNCNKSLIVLQLDSWKRSQADVHIDANLLKVYILLSGLIKWTLSNGETLNIFEGIHWTQQLVIFLLYKSKTVNGQQVGTNLLKCSVSELLDKPNIVEYHLLVQNSVWTALTSCTSLIDCWFLMQSLQSYQVIVDDAFINRSDSINLYLASQTQDLRWSLFFALHVKNDFIRYRTIKELLSRNIDALHENKKLEPFLKTKYFIRDFLISEAKMFSNKTKFDYKSTAFNCIDLGMFKEAHDILMDKVMPELVISENHSEIMAIIEKLQPYQHLIPNWKSSGLGLYDTFIQLLQFNSSSDLSSYKQLVESYNIHQMETPTKRHVLCQGTMACYANIIHSQLNNGMFAYGTPIPCDYAFRELKSNAHKLLQMGTVSN